jgi:hypothetical protein
MKPLKSLLPAYHETACRMGEEAIAAVAATPTIYSMLRHQIRLATTLSVAANPYITTMQDSPSGS